MDELISRQQAITQLSHNKNKGDDEWKLAVENDIQTIWKLPPAEPNITHIIMETLAECGIYGEEATVKLIGTLKRLRRDDLLPPCLR